MAKLFSLTKIAQNWKLQVGLVVAYLAGSFFVNLPIVKDLLTIESIAASLQEALLFLWKPVALVSVIFYFFVYRILADWQKALRATVHLSSLNVLLLADLYLFWFLLVVFPISSIFPDFLILSLLIWAFLIPLLTLTVFPRLSARVLQTYRSKLDYLQTEDKLVLPAALVIGVEVFVVVWSFFGSIVGESGWLSFLF